MKAVFEGTISFGLVSIPVKLYPASEPKMISFNLLCSVCKTPLRYKRWCPKCKTEVKWSNVVKGLKMGKGKWYVLTQKELEGIKPRRTEFIEVKEFVDREQIDPIYFNKNYYCIPQHANDKAYFLFHEVLALTNKAAIVRIIMREKEYLATLTAYKRGLLLTTLHYAYEIRDISRLMPSKKPRLAAQEIDLAKHLISKMYKSRFDPREWKDTYAEELKALIKAKIAGKTIRVKEVEKPKIKNLMEALKASIR